MIPLAAETISDKPGVFTTGVFVGMLVPFAILFGAAFLVWSTRRLRTLVLYAKPKYLERRLNLAAQFVDARRAYRIGGRMVWIALCVGRQYTHDEQAAAVLKDEFMPIPDEQTSAR